MKVFALLCLIGCAVATPQLYWQPGHEYVFEYSGRLLTGYPHLASHYSGLGVNATVKLQVISPEKLQLFVENAKFVKVGQRLEPRTSMDGPDGSNWREIYLPPMTPVDQELRSMLENPIVISLVNGEIRTADIHSQEPEWSVNFKKALALLFQTKVDLSTWKSIDNQVLQPTVEGLSYWTVKEESMDGICENTYQINELPVYMIKDRPELVPYPELCHQEKYYELTKTRNVDTCVRRSSFGFFKPGSYKCAGPNCKDMYSQTTETRYIVCGSRNKLNIQTIINNWELNMKLQGFKNEPLVSGNMQILKLLQVRPVSPKPPTGPRVQMKSMMYEYSYKSYQQQKDQPRLADDIAKMPEELAKVLPRNFLHGLGKPIEQVLPKTKIIQEAKTILKEVVRELENPIESQAGQKMVTMKILGLSRSFSLLRKPELEQVYTTVKSELSNPSEQKVLKNVFFDTILITGTPESIIYLKEKIEAGQVPMSQVISLFMWLPQSLMVPTEEVLEELFQLVQSRWVQECPVTKRVAYMSFTNLLKKACLLPNRRFAYPSSVLGKLCRPESPILMEKWVPHLIQELQSAPGWAKKNEIIMALGMLPHSHIIGKLIPFVEGKYSQEVPSVTRFLALWSLANAGEKEPETIMPIAYSIYANPAESTVMRIGAFKVLIKLNPPMTVFQKIAAKTWNEQDLEVLKTVNIALYTLKQQNIATPEQQISLSLYRKAYLTFPLIKKVHGFFPTSATVYASDYLPKVGAAYQGLTSWIASNTSFIPTEFYTEIKYILDKYEFLPLSLAVFTEGTENVYDALTELITPNKPSMSHQWSSEMRKVFDTLGIKPRDTNQISGALYMSLMETTPIFMNIEGMSSNYLKEKILNGNWKQMISGEKPFNFQRTFDIASTELLIPTDMGYPLIMEYHNPIALSLKGSINVDVTSGSMPSFTLKTKAFYTSQTTGWVGTIIPFTKEYAVTAVDQTTVHNLPATITAHLDVPSHHLKLSVQLDKSIGKPIPLIHYHSHPYTAIKRVDDFSPLTQHKNLIKSEESLKPLSTVFGEYLGLHMKSELRTESRYTDLRSMMDKAAWFKYNPLNILRFSRAMVAIDQDGYMSIRRHEYDLTYDPTQSTTKSINIDLKIGYASKYEGESFEYRKLDSDMRVKSSKLEDKSMHPDRKSKIVSGIKELSNIQTGQAIVFKYVATLAGSGRPRVFAYSAVLAGGQLTEPTVKKVHAKWNFVLESQKSKTKIQMVGKMIMPVLPIWSRHEILNSPIQFDYANSFKYVPNGQPAWSIDIDGEAKTSSEQKEFSRQSVESKLCSKKLSEYGLRKLSPMCEVARQQARTLDEIDFRIKYINVPPTLEWKEESLMQQLKATLWPFLYRDSQNVRSSASIKDSPTQVRILFHKYTPSFDMFVIRPKEKLTFKVIRLPYPLSLALPLKADVNNVKLAVQKATGHAMYPVCKVEDQTLKTFDNRSLAFHIDYCFHLMAADCSSHHQYGVLTRVMRPGNRRELKVLLGPHVLLFTPGQRQTIKEPFSNIKVTIDQEELTIAPNKWMEIKSPMQSQRKLGQIFRSPNNVFKLKAPQYYLDITYDGDDFVIETSQVLKSKMCGLCGNLNNQPRDDLEGPKKCIYSLPELQVASYRIPNMPNACDSERPLNQTVKSWLRSEEQRCVKQRQIPTMITKSMRIQSGKCTLLKHIVIRHPGQVCLSKKPITECSSGCHPVNNQFLRKSVPFTCLNDDRVAEHYAKKAYEGQMLPELASRPTTFETKIPQPRSCVPGSNDI